MRLLSSGKFPLTNISYQVFLDLVQWHSISDHKLMRYDPRVMQFWSTCKILFHTQMLEFMRGNDLMFDETSQRLVNDGQRNFAVPLEIRHGFTQIPDEIQPGRYNLGFENVSKFHIHTPFLPMYCKRFSTYSCHLTQ